MTNEPNPSPNPNEDGEEDKNHADVFSNDDDNENNNKRKGLLLPRVTRDVVVLAPWYCMLKLIVGIGGAGDEYICSIRGSDVGTKISASDEMKDDTRSDEF